LRWLVLDQLSELLVEALIVVVTLKLVRSLVELFELGLLLVGYSCNIAPIRGPGWMTW
jgi:hypothetical protein